MEKDLGLYLHFPFCVRKCGYCDFLSFPADEAAKHAYADAIIREIRSRAKTLKNASVTTVFLGGGTPSVMPVKALEEIFRTLHDSFAVSPEAEITMEANPGTLSEEMISFLSRQVDRVSLGVQSFNDAELRLLGRIHSRDEALQSVDLLKKAGVRNINIDLMSGIPGQTLDSWRASLRTAVGLDLPHVSAYSLIVEEGTPFARVPMEDLHLPDEDTEREMYYETKQILGNAGLERYEISNYARPGYECRHNIRYWRRGDYLGFGIGAASLLNDRRWKNTDDFKNYVKNSGDPALIEREEEDLTARSCMEEFMFLGLRMMRGVTEEDFQGQFHCDLREVYGNVLDKEISEGLMQRDGTRYFLTDRGIDISNWVLSDFLAD